VIIFDLVWFLLKKIIKLNFFLKKSKPVQTDQFWFSFLGQKPVQIGLAWFFRFGSVCFLFGSVFFSLGSVFFVSSL
jgi:hypothetical protein